MTISETNLIIDKAKNKKDGVYSFRGNLYLVSDNRFVAYCDYFGNFFSRAGNFNVSGGKIERHDRRKVLLNLLKQ
jgi:hypothetical protein